MAPNFDISPEKEATKRQCLRRQLFVTPPLVAKKNADLSGKTAIVTGSNGGIGLECSRQLLDPGLSRLIIAVRDEAKGQAAMKMLAAERELKPGQVEVWRLDLASYESITSFVERATQLERLHMVVLNAATGHEEDIQTIYISNQRAPRHSPPAPLQSQGVTRDERSADPLLPAFDDKSAKWDMAERYGTSKLLGQLFLTELAKRVSPSVAVVNAANPGLCYGSELSRDASGLLGLIVRTGMRVLGRPSAHGARSLVDAAAKKGPESHGHYVEDGKLRPMAPIVYTPEGEQVAKRLWNERMEELAFAGVKEIIEEVSDK